MDKETFIQARQAAFGRHFVTEMAERLSVKDRTVRHWVNGRYSLPSTIATEVLAFLQERIAEINAAIE